MRRQDPEPCWRCSAASQGRERSGIRTRPTLRFHKFDSITLTATCDWLASEASDVVLRFGEYDPWSAAQPNELATDVHLFVAPQGNHRSNLGSLTETDFSEAWSEMAAWFAP